MHKNYVGDSVKLFLRRFEIQDVVKEAKVKENYHLYILIYF